MISTQTGLTRPNTNRVLYCTQSYSNNCSLDTMQAGFMECKNISLLLNQGCLNDKRMKRTAHAVTDENLTLIKIRYKEATRFNLMTNDNRFSKVQIMWMKCVSWHQLWQCCMVVVSNENKASDLVEQLDMSCLGFLEGILHIVLISYPADRISLLLCWSLHIFLGCVSKRNKRISKYQLWLYISKHALCEDTVIKSSSPAAEAIGLGVVKVKMNKFNLVSFICQACPGFAYLTVRVKQTTWAGSLWVQVWDLLNHCFTIHLIEPMPWEKYQDN